MQINLQIKRPPIHKTVSTQRGPCVHPPCFHVNIVTFHKYTIMGISPLYNPIMSYSHRTGTDNCTQTTFTILSTQLYRVGWGWLTKIITPSLSQTNCTQS